MRSLLGTARRGVFELAGDPEPFFGQRGTGEIWLANHGLSAKLGSATTRKSIELRAMAFFDEI
jgi:hypothetical protein